MKKAIADLTRKLGDRRLADSEVISWGSPIAAFGDPESSNLATLGINPSNLEFVGSNGLELDGNSRRFHTLKSLRLTRWSDADSYHHGLIAETCREYFHRNPYDRWFKVLNSILSGTGNSYYDSLWPACHLDLVPFATACKWTSLTRAQQSTLFAVAGDSLGSLIRAGSIRTIILNGSAVVLGLQLLSGVEFTRTPMRRWNLGRQSGPDVAGFAFRAKIKSICGVRLGRTVTVLGYNHNLQSSFGVTKAVCDSIRTWIADECPGLH